MVTQRKHKRIIGAVLTILIVSVMVLMMNVVQVLGQQDKSNVATSRQKKTNSIYERYDVIDLVIEKLWSKSNPSETYGYKQLPFCDPKALTDTTLGEDLTGSGDSVISNYDIGFQGMFLHIAPSSSRYTIILQSCILFVVVIIIIIYF